ncbi:uncharacterized protein LOC114828128 [Galendromus occidentalis]|uniref:Uncharacterized protein LOC114828128 n=1 Tax=Galendromus occidentalis TaxID=34638 RepID=A0AAJ7SF98_9ACAR|nr:uncharacterized protein LOC114828128 [Galendromus occidentalis]
MPFANHARITERSQAVDILWPLFKSLHVVGAGPFRRHVDGTYEGSMRQKPLQKLANSIGRFMLVRFMAVGVLRFFFARHLVGAAASDVVRAVCSVTALSVLNANLEKLHSVILVIDEAPTRAYRNASLCKLAKFWLASLWIYVGYRFTLDVVTFFVDDRLTLYLETDLFIPFGVLPPFLIPPMYVVAISDILINRIFVTGALAFSITLNFLLNMLFDSKVQHFDEELRRLSDGDEYVLDGNQALELRMRHAKLCQYAQISDDIFSLQNLVWHAVCVALACAESAASVQMMRRNFQLLRFLGTLGNLVIMVVLMVANTGSAAIVCECRDRSRVFVNCLQSRTGAGSPVSHQVSQMDQRVQLTAWKMYKLDRAAIMTTLGACVTYVSLVIQRTEDALEN